MKISDIIASRGKKELNSSLPEQAPYQPTDMETMKRQREELEQELEESMLEPVQQQQQQPYQQFIPHPQPQPQPQPRMMVPPIAPVPTPEQQVFKMSIFLDNGQKLPVTFSAYPEEVVMILLKFDSDVESGKIVTIGDFKFPGEKLLYVDLQGR